MAEAVEKAVPKKRQAKAGTHRVTVTLTEEEFESLTNIATDQMREPNNMLSFMLKGRISGILQDFTE